MTNDLMLTDEDLTTDDMAELVLQLVDEATEATEAGVQSVSVSGSVVLVEMENGQVFRLTVTPATVDDLFA